MNKKLDKKTIRVYNRITKIRKGSNIKQPIIPIFNGYIPALSDRQVSSIKSSTFTTSHSQMYLPPNYRDGLGNTLVSLILKNKGSPEYVVWCRKCASK